MGLGSRNLLRSDVIEWLAKGAISDDAKVEQLRLLNVLQHGPSLSDKEELYLAPLLLRLWAGNNSDTSLGYLLHEAYNADLQVTKDSPKLLDNVLLYQEAARRVALVEYNDGVVGVKNYFNGGQISEEFSGTISILPPDRKSLPPEGLVKYLGDTEKNSFLNDHTDDVISRLSAGHFVFSNHDNEPGIEGLSPFWYNKQGKQVMGFFAYQDKFEVTGDSYQSRIEKIATSDIVKTLINCGYRCVPVMYSTSQGNTYKPKAESKKYVPKLDNDTLERIAKAATDYNMKDWVLFDEIGMFENTRRLGVLRHHHEKCSDSLKAVLGLGVRKQPKRSNCCFV